MPLFTYESDEIAKICQGTHSSDTLYVADCKKEILTEVSPNYPKLTDYEKEWMYFAKNIYHGGGTPVPLEYLEVQTYDHATVENVIPFAYKRAIFNGNTEKVFSPLKNLFDGFLEIGSIDDNKGTFISNNIYYRNANFIAVEPSTTYLISTNGTVNGRLFFYDINFNFISTSLSASIELSPSNATYMRFRVDASRCEDKIQVEKGKVVTDYEEPNYILQSVKKPVLTSYNYKILDTRLDSFIPISGGKVPTVDFETSTVVFPSASTGYYMDYVFKANETLTVGFEEATGFVNLRLYDMNGFSESNIVVRNLEHGKSYTPDRDCRLRVWTNEVNATIKGLKFIKGNININEPHKLNILTVNEEVELRGIGEVKDELNLLTGKVTERIGEVVLNGSESWFKHDAYSTDEMNVYWTHNNFISSSSKTTEIVCDKLPVLNPSVPNSIRTNGDGGIFIGLPSEVDITSFLQSNPVTVHYKLATESIKTVNLSGIIKPYEGTNHYTVTSDTIPPQLILLVPIESTGNKTLNDINTEE